MHSLTKTQIKNVWKWIKALRSGKFKQTKNVLCRTKGKERSYCCLGVACKILKCKEENSFDDFYNSGIVLFDGQGEDLPDGVVKKLGLKDCTGGFDRYIKNGDTITRLSDMNDTQKAKFTTIADKIEKNLKTNEDHLFVEK